MGKIFNDGSNIEQALSQGMDGWFEDQYNELKADITNTANKYVDKAKETIGLKTATSSDADGEAGPGTDTIPVQAKPFPWAWVGGAAAVLIGGILIFRKPKRKRKK